MLGIPVAENCKCQGHAESPHHGHLSKADLNSSQHCRSHRANTKQNQKNVPTASVTHAYIKRKRSL